ncbi:Monoacylglycerol lipase ABHD2 [Hondaea fermentalgiana]|uniref:Monoacylglycerol lipase ABHD2 n=1 Tax=Hondaea fermentalgiana TaxID=2315210 RepID=A0A2R5GSL2_9STRA|nr:Monoacylglycerol lipase ABHD2 [Hondaea fermentalgiana]|eukprot:GBG33866.1 Monoacylglycerol lipase ABHD2 [Hondaea fermentalgiana]
MAAVLAAVLAARLVYVQKTKQNEICYSAESEKSSRLVQSIRHVAATYVAPWWAPTGVLQTIVAELMSTEPELAKGFRRETLQLAEMKKRPESTCCPDVVPSGVVSLDWLDGDRPATAPIILLVPGLTGSSESAFIRRAAKHLTAAGFRVACYNPRGRGGNALETPFLYSAGFTEDLRRVVKHVRETNGSAKCFFAAGYSLGSNYLAKFVGEEGESCLLDGAACLACPVDCLSIAHSLNTTVGGRLMNPILVSFVKKMATHHREVLERAPDLFDFVQMEETRTMQHFDHVMTAPSFGFDTASDYYRYASSGLVLHRIARPTLFISARNDPICPGSSIHMDSFETNRNLISVRTAAGGHSMDWPTSTLESWSAKVLVQYFTALVQEC